jgi:hypothetical protein
MAISEKIDSFLSTRKEPKPLEILLLLREMNQEIQNLRKIIEDHIKDNQRHEC